ncbi:MAG: hypothetical protein H6843_16635 [Rhodospirillaceae bacterium]|nr:hypothetical protein [Rhodospirillaceae bacterium]
MTDPDTRTPLDTDALAAIEDAYLNDRPAPLPGGAADAALTPALLLRPAEGAAYDTLPALALIAAWDPSEATAMAALVRLVGWLAGSDDAVPTLAGIAAEARHDSVRHAALGLLRPDITRNSVAALCQLAGETFGRPHLPGELGAFIDSLCGPDAPRDSAIPRLLALAELAGADGDAVTAALREVVSSPAVPLPTKLATLDDIDRLDSGVAATLRAHVLALPANEWTDPLRRAIRLDHDDDMPGEPAATAAHAAPATIDLPPLPPDDDAAWAEGAADAVAADCQFALFGTAEALPADGDGDGAPRRGRRKRGRFAWPEEEHYPSRRPPGETVDDGGAAAAAPPAEPPADEVDGPSLLSLLRRLQRSEEAQ